MSFRIWSTGPKGEIVHPTMFGVLPGLPKGLRRADGPDYLLSGAYSRALGINLPRRAVLVGLATSMAATGVALRPARAIPGLVTAGIVAVTVGAALIKVFKATWGSFDAKNDKHNQVEGYVSITVTDDKSDTVEGSITSFYSFPPKTTVNINFTGGPHATTKGDKTLEVGADDSSDSDSFEAN